MTPCLAEKALVYLFVEQNLVGRDQLVELTRELDLDVSYLSGRLADNRRSVPLD